MSFDTLAPYYHWLEFALAGEKLQRCRTTFINEIPAARNILLLGEGHGRSLVEYRRRFTDARITCVDASEKMLTHAHRRLECHNLKSRHVEFIHADVLSWTSPEETYDLIVTNFFLDCFRAEQLERMIPRLTATTTPGANWLIADFQVPTGGLKRIRSQLVLWTMYAFFRTMTRISARKLTAPDSFLTHTNFTLHRRRESEWGLLRSDWWQRSITKPRGTDLPRHSRLPQSDGKGPKIRPVKETVVS